MTKNEAKLVAAISGILSAWERFAYETNGNGRFYRFGGCYKQADEAALLYELECATNAAAEAAWTNKQDE